jgi:flagellar hook-length control protein FliK
MKIDSSPIMAFPSATGPDHAEAQARARRTDANAGDGFAALFAGDPVPQDIGATFVVPDKLDKSGDAQRDAGAQGRAGSSTIATESPDLASPDADREAILIVPNASSDGTGSPARFDTQPLGVVSLRTLGVLGHLTAKYLTATGAEGAAADPHVPASGQLPPLVQGSGSGAPLVQTDAPSAVRCTQARPTRLGDAQRATATTVVDMRDGVGKARITRTPDGEEVASGHADATSMAAAVGISGHVLAAGSYQASPPYGDPAEMVTNAEPAPRSASATANLGARTAPDLARTSADGTRARSMDSDTLALTSLPRTEPQPGAQAKVAQPLADQGKSQTASTGGVADATDAGQLPSLPFWAVPWLPPADNTAGRVDAAPLQGTLAPVVIGKSLEGNPQRSPAASAEGLPSDATSRHIPTALVDQALVIASVEASAVRAVDIAGVAKTAPLATGGDGGSRATLPPAAPLTAAQPAAAAIGALVGVVTTQYSVLAHSKGEPVAVDATQPSPGEHLALNATATANDESAAKASVDGVSLVLAPATFVRAGHGDRPLNRANASATTSAPELPSADPPGARERDHSGRAVPASADHLPSTGVPFAVPKDVTGPAANVPFAAAGIAREIAHQAATSLGGDPKHTDGKQIEIALAPDELGHVRITMSGDNGAMTLTIHAERQDTLDLLRRNIDTLAQEFQSLGYTNTSFSFGQWSGQSAPQRTPAPASSHETDFSTVPSALAPPRPRQRGGNRQGLDIRL